MKKYFSLDGVYLDLSEIIIIYNYKIKINGRIYFTFKYQLRNKENVNELSKEISEKVLKEIVKKEEEFLIFPNKIKEIKVYQNEKYYETHESIKYIKKEYLSLIKAWKDWKDYEVQNKKQKSFSRLHIK